ncbi:response regulator receiver modulated diguanylate cyclase [Thiogranum longum]|uniref:diguanylate cyclase n=2 Tax=Thiogranum longum TaxID=1537524 RepID=A0A4R1HE33_9GAMM|nr:response regulator receiver modulated diguanylate cyclase [Thiogranum longum]
MENDQSEPDINSDNARWAVVLLVDDQPMVAEGIRRMIADEPDIEFHYCSDPKQALRDATKVKATVILQDLVMPEIDGMTLVRFYRNNPATRDVPVIVLSSKDDPNIKSDAFNQGATDYLVKLPEKVELLARIRAHAKSYLAQKERDQAFKSLRKMQEQLEIMNHELAHSNQELQRLSSLDGLTGVANRRQFDETLDQEWQRAQRTDMPLSLIFADIDFFKRYNDHYGHQAGDDTLKKVAGALSMTVHRPADLVSRYGGEEFVMVLPDTTLEGAVTVAEKVLDSIKALNIPHENTDQHDRVTLSIGVATLSPGDRDKPDRLVEAADKALYRAKEAGRNRVESSNPAQGEEKERASV